MKSYQLMDKWARKKLKEQKEWGYYVDIPEEDDYITVSFETEYGGYCETCSYEEDVVKLYWTNGEYTLRESYSMDEILKELLEEKED